MTNSYLSIILEEIRDEIKTVHEVVAGMQQTMKGLATKDELSEVADDVKTIKVAVGAHGHELQDHEMRISRLEQAKS